MRKKDRDAGVSMRMAKNRIKPQWMAGNVIQRKPEGGEG